MNFIFLSFNSLSKFDLTNLWSKILKGNNTKSILNLEIIFFNSSAV